jgi:hypothetical protein
MHEHPALLEKKMRRLMKQDKNSMRSPGVGEGMRGMRIRPTACYGSAYQVIGRPQNNTISMFRRILLRRSLMIPSVLLIILLWACRQQQFAYRNSHQQTGKVYALHLINHESDADLRLLGTCLPELERMGINLLILEVDYAFNFQSHPELRDVISPITKEGAQELARKCKEHGIRLVPEFQCLGHQSWEGFTSSLLTQYPEFDLTPGAYPGNAGIYCREWNPLDSRLKKIVFELMDEIIEAFSADAFHVGMDEIFLITNRFATATKTMDPAVVFADAIKDFHSHLVGKRGVEMMMWGDRLIEGRKYPQYDEKEASNIGTAPAVDMIPKDIIICDWHYRKMGAYPSIPMFLEKGFRVLPTSWKDIPASKALIQYSFGQNNPRMLGHLFTTWNGKINDLINDRSLIEGLNYLYRNQK